MSLRSHGPAYTAISSLEKIAQQYAEVHDQCVAVLTRQLRRYTENDLELNGFLVSSLVELKAVESAKVIECAFVGNRVDPFIVGWDDVQVKLSLKSPEAFPHHSNSEALSPLLSNSSPPLMAKLLPEDEQLPEVTHYRKTGPKAKAKRKMEKQARKKKVEVRPLPKYE